MAEKDRCSSPLAKPLPRSPKIAKLQECVSKKSPLRSPLRDVLKKRCAERMKSSRTKLLDGLRGVEEVQKEIRDMIKDEAAAFKSRRRSLQFGLTDEEVDAALEELHSIELELLEVTDILSDSDLSLVCPICLKHPLKCVEISDMIWCSGQCGNLFKLSGGLLEVEKQFENILHSHSKECDLELSWGTAVACVLAFCDVCEFCAAVGET